MKSRYYKYSGIFVIYNRNLIAMVIDNTKVVVRDRQMMYMMAISLTIIIPIFCFADVFDNPVFGINRELYIIVTCAIYLLVNIYRFVLDLNYIYFNDFDDKLVFKFYTLRPFMQKRRSIEIKKESFCKFKIKKSIAGQKKSLILFQLVKNKVAKYPPISISALNEEEYNNLLSSLNAVSKAKK